MKKLIMLAILLAALENLTITSFAASNEIVYQEETKDSKVTVIHESTVPVSGITKAQMGITDEDLYASTYAVTLEKTKSREEMDSTMSYKFNVTAYYSVKYTDPTGID